MADVVTVHLYVTDENDVEVDVIDDVIISDAWFQAMTNGKPGQCSFRIKDRVSNPSVTPRFPDIGARIRLTINGENEWRGFVMKRDYEYAFSVEDTSDYRQTMTKFLVVEGMDYNLLFSRRIMFNQATPTAEIPIFPQGMTDQAMIAELFDKYVDMSGLGLDLVSGVTNVGTPGVYEEFKACAVGDTLGQALNIVSLNLGAIFYIDPNKVFRWVDDEIVTAPHPLSDAPFGGDVGYREMSIVNSAERLCNDFTVRGAGVGSPEMVVSRKTDSTSITIHGIFQEAELHNDMYKQLTADRRANTYVIGSPQNRRGHKDDWDTVTCTIFTQGYHVGEVVDFESLVHGWSDNIPIRASRITFPTPTSARWELTLSHDIDPGLTYADWPGPKGKKKLPWGETVTATDVGLSYGIMSIYDPESVHPFAENPYEDDWIDRSPSPALRLGGATDYSGGGNYGIPITSSSVNTGVAQAVRPGWDWPSFPFEVEFVWDGRPHQYDWWYWSTIDAGPAGGFTAAAAARSWVYSVPAFLNFWTGVDWIDIGPSVAGEEMVPFIDAEYGVDIPRYWRHTKINVTATGWQAKTWDDGDAEPGAWDSSGSHPMTITTADLAPTFKYQAVVTDGCYQTGYSWPDHLEYRWYISGMSGDPFGDPFTYSKEYHYYPSGAWDPEVAEPGDTFNWPAKWEDYTYDWEDYNDDPPTTKYQTNCDPPWTQYCSYPGGGWEPEYGPNDPVYVLSKTWKRIGGWPYYDLQAGLSFDKILVNGVVYDDFTAENGWQGLSTGIVELVNEGAAPVYRTSHPYVAGTLKGSVAGTPITITENADHRTFIPSVGGAVQVTYIRSDAYQNGEDDPGYYDDPGSDQYDPGGGGSGDWRWPCSGTITQDYGCTAFGGANGYEYGDGCPVSAPYWHDGIDIANASATPIRAPDNGVINFVGWNPYDDYDPAFICTIDLVGGYQVGFAHLLPIYKVRAGQTVIRGELIGYMGSTGNSTGTHLHFEARYNGQEFNPQSKLSGGPS